MVHMDVVKLRAIFDSLLTDMEAVVSEHDEFARDNNDLRTQLAIAHAEVNTFKSVHMERTRLAIQLRKARETIKALKSATKNKKRR